MTLVERLPASWTALADGRLDWPRARALARELGWPARGTDPELVAEVEAAVLPEAMEMSVTRLASARRELLTRDAAAADRRRRQAERAADVTVRGLGDGMAELRAVMPQPLAAMTGQALDMYARMAEDDGDGRLLGQLRVGMLADLVRRAWDTSRPPVTAAHLRELIQELDSLCPGGLQAPVGGSLDIALVDPATGGQRAVVTRAQLERLVRRGCPDHPGADCSCSLLERPDPLDR
jgi:hypothetical protein